MRMTPDVLTESHFKSITNLFDAQQIIPEEYNLTVKDYEPASVNNETKVPFLSLRLWSENNIQPRYNNPLVSYSAEKLVIHSPAVQLNGLSNALSCMNPPQTVKLSKSFCDPSSKVSKLTDGASDYLHEDYCILPH